MRNDYTGYGLLKDIEKYKKEILNTIITPEMDTETKTLIRIEVNSLNYKDLVKKLKEIRK